jgi:hypothetical protein
MLYCRQACLALLLQNDGELLRPHLKEEEISLVLETCCPYINDPDNLELDIRTHDNIEEFEPNNQDTAKERSYFNQTIPGENPFIRQRMRTGRQNPEMCKVIHLLWSTPPVRNLVKKLGQQVCSHLLFNYPSLPSKSDTQLDIKVYASKKSKSHYHVHKNLDSILHLLYTYTIHPITNIQGS